MKSFVAYPLDLEKFLFPAVTDKGQSGKLIVHYELFKKVSHIEGTVVKCGIAAEEGLTRLSIFRSLISSAPDQMVVAFERFNKSLFVENRDNEKGSLQYKVKRSATDLENIKETLLQKGITGKINFVPGSLEYTIPDYLIENPDLKISFLNIDLDDYEATLTALQFFYPRLVHGGILVFDNYYKKEEDYKAITDYFGNSKIAINNLSVNKGPHYTIRH
ncbi:MAG: dTDP-6-deoxy-L-hexose 3-O-methyltransferase [Segetibacter sp.]|jgi:hypothetical protein|nr:dTDP-6-deoxy-L-hexose 3-O-methyltransferase [Segetibacter sp.]